jgi:hypothetical protein
MKKQLRRLRLRKGDVLVCRLPEDVKRIAKAPISLGFDVPIVFCEGSVHRLSREYLQKLLDRTQ